VTDVGFGPEFYKSLEGTSNLLLSRTNAPMVQACFTCWKNNIPALIRGRDVAATIANTIKRHSGKGGRTNAEISADIIDEFDAKITNYRAQDRDDMAEAKIDEREVILSFLAETKTPEDAIKAVWDMFDDRAKARAIQFSTVHKAKGLEADNIGILTPSILPHPGICKMGAFWTRQEKNIAYVCYTRGKQNMFLNTEG
jgi:superfamily I DNA/RNA helicase